MATTVAHGLIGVACYCAARSFSSGDKKLPLNLGTLMLAVLFANIPDLDMLVSLMVYGDHRVLHGGVSHTLLFAVTGGVLVWVFTRRYTCRVELSIAAAFILLSHVLVDVFTGANIGFYPTHGAAPFWPALESRLFLPVTIFKGVEHSNILPGALLTALWELLLLLPVTLIIVCRSCKNDPRCKFNFLSGRHK